MSKRKSKIKKLNFHHEEEDIAEAIGVEEDLAVEVMSGLQKGLIERLKSNDPKMSKTIEDIFNNYSKAEIAMATGFLLHELFELKEQLMAQMLGMELSGEHKCTCGEDSCDPEKCNEKYECQPIDKNDPMYG